MTREERELALYCLKASSDFHEEVCEECKKYPNCDHFAQDNLTETIIKALSAEPCEDAISRESALEALSDYVASGYAESYEDFKGYSASIAKLPSVKVEPQECKDEKFEELMEQYKHLRKYASDLETKLSVEPQEWISVKDRLPKDAEAVLITIRRMDKSFNQIPFISVGYISWNQQAWWCAHDGDCKENNIEVLAWMPLPSPYKGE